jgi:nitrite reductase/ring-hydroxylating ferredoxin subunit
LSEDRPDAEVVLLDDDEVGPVVVVRRGAKVRAWRNLCPHHWLPLTYRSEKILSADGMRLRCSNHGAEFSADDGPLGDALPRGPRARAGTHRRRWPGGAAASGVVAAPTRSRSFGWWALAGC